MEVKGLLVATGEVLYLDCESLRETRVNLKSLDERHFLPTGDYGTNRITIVADILDVRLNEFHVWLGADYNHSHPHVKGSIHFDFRDVSDLLQYVEHRQAGPTSVTNLNGFAFG